MTRSASILLETILYMTIILMLFASWLSFSQQNQRALCNQLNYYLCREDLYHYLWKKEPLRRGFLIKNGEREVYYLGQNIYRFKGPTFDFNYQIPLTS